MSKATIFKNLAKKEQQDDKKAEVGYVRAEKAADAAITKRLEEAYGVGPARDDGARRRAWRCLECHFQNFESRISCANCLAVSERKDAPARPENIAVQPTARDSSDPTVQLTRVGSRCYRSYSGGGYMTAPATRRVQELAVIEDDDVNDDGEEGVVCSAAGGARMGYDCERKMFVLRMPCAARYHRFVVGQQAKTLKDIERTANVKLTVPKSSKGAHDGDDDDESSAPNPDDDFVLIEGSSSRDVKTAQLRIDAIMTEAKDKVEYTHFLSIPLGPIPSARAAFASLIDDMKQALVSESSAVEADIFQRPSRVHITLLMLRLHTRSEVETAKLLLESLEPELQHIFGPNDCVTLRGLNVMTGDAKSAHVLYMDVSRDDVQRRLQSLVSRLNNAFIDAGLAKVADVQGNGKLHATLMNSKWRKGRAHVPFNATDALRVFGDRAFGMHKLRSIEVNVLGGAAADDGYFGSISSIRFP